MQYPDDNPAFFADRFAALKAAIADYGDVPSNGVLDAFEYLGVMVEIRSINGNIHAQIAGWLNVGSHEAMRRLSIPLDGEWRSFSTDHQTGMRVIGFDVHEGPSVDPVARAGNQARIAITVLYGLGLIASDREAMRPLCPKCAARTTPPRSLGGSRFSRSHRCPACDGTGAVRSIRAFEADEDI